MSFWRQLIRGVRLLGSRRAADQEIADEVRHCMEESESALIAKGLSPEEARRAARLELGSATAIREQVRGYGWENTIGGILADLKFALRILNPLFKPAIGRVFNSAEDDQVYRGHPVVALSYDYRMTRFAGDRSVVGKKMLSTAPSPSTIFPGAARWDGA